MCSDDYQSRVIGADREMETELSRALDECLYRISNGEAIEACLGKYPRVSEQLESLLRTALSISAAPKLSASDEFRKASKVRLMARLSDSASDPGAEIARISRVGDTEIRGLEED